MINLRVLTEGHKDIKPRREADPRPNYLRVILVPLFLRAKTEGQLDPPPESAWAQTPTRLRRTPPIKAGESTAPLFGKLNCTPEVGQKKQKNMNAVQTGEQLQGAVSHRGQLKQGRVGVEWD